MCARRLLPMIVLGLGAVGPAANGQVDPPPSWNDGPAKRAIAAFVEKVTKAGSPDIVPASQRIAAFDNDGTLWIEQPIYVQVAFGWRPRKTADLGGCTPSWCICRGSS